MLTPPELQKAVRGHYSRSVKRHLLSTLGSLQALGNPVGLLRGLAQGASDAVAEPLEGLVRTVEKADASHLADGLQRGATSLVQVCTIQNLGFHGFLFGLLRRLTVFQRPLHVIHLPNTCSPSPRAHLRPNHPANHSPPNQNLGFVHPRAIS